jgi:hypothetical protein
LRFFTLTHASTGQPDPHGPDASIPDVHAGFTTEGALRALDPLKIALR